MSKARSDTSRDTAICPLCGNGNDCAMSQPDGASSECWCMKATFGTDVLSRVPATMRGVACICSRCAVGSPPPTE